MGIFDIFRGRGTVAPTSGGVPVVHNSDAGRLISTPQELDEYLRGINGAAEKVTEEQLLRLTAVQTCLRLIGGGVSNTPFKVMRDIGDDTKEEATSTELYTLLRKRPNQYMRPAQFFRMSCAHVMLRGNFYCLKVRGGNGHVKELLPIHPDRIRPEMTERQQVVYKYTHPRTNRVVTLTRNDVLHLYLMTLNGYQGVTPIAYARNAVVGTHAMEEHGTKTFENGARVAGILTTEKRLGPEGRENLRAGLDEYREKGKHDGKELILEDGVTYERMGLTSQDAQYIESRKMGKADIYEIFGIPLHMTALAEKQSNWGTGVEQHNKQFIQWVLNDYYVMWEEAVNCDLTGDGSDLEAKFDRRELTKGDIEAQTKQDQSDLQWGVLSPNEVRIARGINPRPGGDVYYPPPNMTDDGEDTETNEDKSNEPSEAS